MACHFTLEERVRLSELKGRGQSQAEIAHALGRHPSTISRELRRNNQDCGYMPVAAQSQAEERRRQRPRKMDREDISEYVRSGLVKYWSPEQIAGRAQRDFPKQPERHISHQTIYTWIDRDSCRSHWEQYLRHHGHKRTEPEKRGQIPNRVDVAGRPKVVAQRRRYGDWEGDTVVGRRRRSAVVTLVERKSRYTALQRVRDLRARTVRHAVRESLRPIPENLRHTLTFDNGKEFAEHERLEEQLSVAVYFAKPYAAWQRGVNENTNGLLRQFYPKGTDFLEVRPSDLARTQDLLNNRPRKCIGYQTPAEVLRSRGVAFET